MVVPARVPASVIQVAEPDYEFSGTTVMVDPARVPALF
jgi:hypothetical protein